MRRTTAIRRMAAAYLMVKFPPTSPESSRLPTALPSAARDQIFERNRRAQRRAEGGNLQHHVAQPHHQTQQRPQHCARRFPLVAYRLHQLFLYSNAYKIRSVFHLHILPFLFLGLRLPHGGFLQAAVDFTILGVIKLFLF